MPLQQIFRPRRINWNLLVNPSMQALAIREAGDRDMNQSIMAGLAAASSNIRQNVANKESSRRFDEQMDFRKEQFGLQEDKFEFEKDKREEDRRDAQAADEALLEALGGTMKRGAQEIQVQGDLSPETAGAAEKTIDALGGLPAADQKARMAAQSRPLTFEQYKEKHCSGST